LYFFCKTSVVIPPIREAVDFITGDTSVEFSAFRATGMRYAAARAMSGKTIGHYISSSVEYSGSL
jgi:hypothetical protein